MKTQRRPFRVERKRGTSRSSFISQNQEPDVFRKAEAQLSGLGNGTDSDPTGTPHKEVTPPRRVLLAIEEPQAPLLPSSYDAPSPRGRKPGSKNKPKAFDALVEEEMPIGLDVEEGTPKRRGRPLGSKIRPKASGATQAPEILKSASAATARAEEGPSDEQEPNTTFETLLSPRRRGRPIGSRNKPKDSTTVPSLSRKDRNAFEAVCVTPNELIVVTASTNDSDPHAEIVRDGGALSKAGTAQPKRERLRERSKILRWYVCGGRGRGKSQKVWSNTPE